MPKLSAVPNRPAEPARMDAPKIYRVRAIAEPGQPFGPQAEFAASGDFEALAQAQRLLGADTPFDLYQDRRMVMQHRPRGALKSRG